MNKRIFLSASISILALTSCAQIGQDQYSYNDVGQSMVVEFGSVVAVREVNITGENSGTGGLLGAGTGAGAASYIGGGTGNIWAMAAGAVVGGIAGLASEQALSDGKGIEYLITKENGQTLTLVQNKKEGDVIFAPGTRVMVQTSGSYQRVLPANHLPEQIKRPKGITVID